MKIGLINHFIWLTNEVWEISKSSGNHYEFMARELIDAQERFFNSLKLETNSDLIDFGKLTPLEAKELGFRYWSKEDEQWEGESKLMLFPVWIYPLIPEGLMVTTIGGDTLPFERPKFDCEGREHCLGYGLMLGR